MLNTLAGIIASSGGAAAGGDYESIATASGTGSSGTITFSSIPSTYQHLQIRVLAKSTGTAAGGADCTMTFNGDSTYTNYYSHWLRGNGSAASAGALQTSGYYVYLNQFATSGSGQTSMYGVSVIDVLDYANTNKNKTVRALGGFDLNGSGDVRLISGLWNSTSAVNSLTISLNILTDSFTSDTRIALYGLKG